MLNHLKSEKFYWHGGFSVENKAREGKRENCGFPFWHHLFICLRCVVFALLLRFSRQHEKNCAMKIYFYFHLGLFPFLHHYSLYGFSSSLFFFVPCNILLLSVAKHFRPWIQSLRIFHALVVIECKECFFLV